jgi:hypothetical protein
MEISIKMTSIIAYINALFSVFNHIFVNQILHITDKFVEDFYKFAAANKRELSIFPTACEMTAPQVASSKSSLFKFHWFNFVH